MGVRKITGETVQLFEIRASSYAWVMDYASNIVDEIEAEGWTVSYVSVHTNYVVDEFEDRPCEGTIFVSYA